MGSQTSLDKKKQQQTKNNKQKTTQKKTTATTTTKQKGTIIGPKSNSGPDVKDVALLR